MITGSDGKSAVLGASGEDTAGELAGCAFVYEETGGIWRTGAQLLADDAADNDLFGAAVAMSPDGSIVVVGARVSTPAIGRCLPCLDLLRQIARCFRAATSRRRSVRCK